MDEKSRAVQFCSKMIYTVGPERRSVKQKMGDKTWVFKFPYEEEGKLVVKAAFVCTFKNEGAKYDLSVNNSSRMVLSVRHASLLAIETMNRITDICVSHRMLNSSCQSGGHYLKGSELAVAALASIVATTKLGAKGKNDERIQIITKVIKQYLNHKIIYTSSVLTALSRFDTGGVPTDLEPGKLIKVYAANKEIGKTSKLNAIVASRLTRLNIEGSRLAGQIYDDEEGEFTRSSEPGLSLEAMDELRIRNDLEDEMVKKAIADSLVLKRFRPDPSSKVMILDNESMSKLLEFRNKKGLSNTIPPEFK